MTVGQQYLTSLRESATRQRERQSKARALSVQMHRMFLPIAEEITCKRMDSGKMLLDIAHLIDNKTVERYQNKYSSATAGAEGVPDAAFRAVASVSLCAARQWQWQRRAPAQRVSQVVDCERRSRGERFLLCLRIAYSGWDGSFRKKEAEAGAQGDAAA